jgi:dihydrofolate synthase/folylpolyglutamate synthase
MSRVEGHGPQRDAKRSAPAGGPGRRSPGADRSGEPEGSATELSETVAALRSRVPQGALTLTMEPIRRLTELLGDPQRAYPVIHVAGTNGKTSTARMIERLLREHGLRTGRFTSPDLGDLRQQIAVDGVDLTTRQFVDSWREVRPFVEITDAWAAGEGRPPVSMFEVQTAMALSAFADAPVDVAVVEVGLGGTLDATNVVDGAVAVITPIGLDHQTYLGDDLAEIAGQKAGIIKAGAVAVLSEQEPEALEELLARAGHVGATVLREDHQFGLIGREVALGGQLITLQGGHKVYDEIFLPIHGDYQAHNAAVALAAVETFLAGPGAGDAQVSTAGLDVDLVRAAFADVDSPGRLEVVRRDPTVIVDGAHNPAAAQVVAENVEEAFGFSRLVGLVAILDDKDAEGILGALEPVLAEVVITRTSSPRAMPPDELRDIAEDVFGEDRVSVFERLDDALDFAMGKAEEGGLIGGGVLATGSLTMVAEVGQLLRPRPRRRAGGRGTAR